MLSRFRINSLPLFSRRVVYVAFAVLACSSISFEVLDLDGSGFPSQLDPSNGYAIKPHTGNDAGRVHRSEVAESRSELPAISLTRQVGLVSRRPSEEPISSPFHSARNNGYRVALPRSSTTDPSIPSSPNLHS